MRVAICGANGYLGTNLSRYLVEESFEIVRIGREHFLDVEVLKNSLEGVDVVLNCCGESFFKRWDESYKHLLYVSRIETTKMLIRAIGKCSQKPHTYIACSSTLIYKDGMIHNDNSLNYGSDYIALLLKEYESEAKKITSLGIRLVTLRFGYMIGEDSPFLSLLRKACFLCFGFIIGSGKQLVSWIDLHDAMKLLRYAMEHETFRGTYNAASSDVVPMKKLLKIFGKCLRKFTFLKYPQHLLKLFLKEEANNLLKGSFIISKKLEEDGYRREFCSLEQSLKKFCKKK
jgi:hypothetical protein